MTATCCKVRGNTRTAGYGLVSASGSLADVGALTIRALSSRSDPPIMSGMGPLKAGHVALTQQSTDPCLEKKTRRLGPPGRGASLFTRGHIISSTHLAFGQISTTLPSTQQACPTQPRQPGTEEDDSDRFGDNGPVANVVRSHAMNVGPESR
jgi:hypothetical protein